MTDVVDDRLEAVLSGLAACFERRLGVTDVTIDNPSRPSGGHSGNMVLFTAEWRNGDGRTESRDLIARMEQIDLRLLSTERYDLMREYKVMDGLADSPVRVPQMVLSEPDGGEVGFPFYVMEQVPGRVPQDHPPYHVDGFMQTLSHDERARLWNSGLDTLGQLHALDPFEHHGFLNRPEIGANGLEQSVRWIQDWYGWISGGERHEVLDAAVTFLRDNAPAESTDSVLWGDARPGNMIFNLDGSVAAVIDWELCSIGPAELDFGYWLVMDHLCGPGVYLDRLDGLPGRSASIDRYERALGRSVHHLEYYEIFGAMRFALVLLRVEKVFQSRGRLPASSRFGRGSHAVALIAELLGMPVPPIHRDILLRQRPDLPDDFTADGPPARYPTVA